MKTDEWLYGENVRVPKIPKDVIEERLKLLKAQLRLVVMADSTTHDNHRLNDILSAMDFWRKMGDDEARV